MFYLMVDRVLKNEKRIKISGADLKTVCNKLVRNHVSPTLTICVDTDDDLSLVKSLFPDRESVKGLVDKQALYLHTTTEKVSGISEEILCWDIINGREKPTVTPVSEAAKIVFRDGIILGISMEKGEIYW